jgi:hypothetical protein
VTEFATLLHAYGRATDTPAHLAALAAGSPSGLDHLWSAIIHQGTPWTATAPAALAVAEMVGGLASAELRAGLLSFLAAVAEAGRDYPQLTDLAPPPGFDFDATLATALAADAEDELYGDEIMANALYLVAVQGCHEITPILLTTAVESLSDPAPEVRSAAAQLVGACAAQPPAETGSRVATAAEAGSTAPTAGAGSPAAAGAGSTAAAGAGSTAAAGAGSPVAAVATSVLAGSLTALAARAEPDERAALVLTMGELGLSPVAYLADPHPGVRACAALAPALAADPRATAEILAALADPAAVESWFTRRPPQFHAHIRFTLIAAAIERAPTPADLLPAALAIAGVGGVGGAAGVGGVGGVAGVAGVGGVGGLFTINGDWGRLLIALRPDPAAQRHYLSALVERAELWDPRNGSAGLVFREAGLPYDREACRALLNS